MFIAATPQRAPGGKGANAYHSPNNSDQEPYKYV